MDEIFKKYKMYGFKLFFNFVFIEIKNKIFTQLIKNSYSQVGEDLIIDKLLGNKKRGFYVDVGANDPCRFSNTKRFYKKGWRGINIEPNVVNYEKLVKSRKEDINLNIGIGENNQKLKFYKFFPDTVSTFSVEHCELSIKAGYVLQDVLDIEVKKLSEILDIYCKSIIIDFFSIDTEGFDYQVLKSNDWDKYRPRIICVESIPEISSGFLREENDHIDNYLIKIGYRKVCSTSYNSIYLLDL